MMNTSWRVKMDTPSSKRRGIETPTLVAVIVGLHIMAVGSIVFIQGCGTTRTANVEPPPAPVMPEGSEIAQTPPVTPRPGAVFQPSTPAPAQARPAAPAPAASSPAAQTYTVRSGDNLSTIARNHGVSMQEILALNQMTDADKILVDQTLLLPPHARPRSAPAQTQATPRAPAAPAVAARPVVATDGEYVVRSGDVLSTIARRHNVSVAALSAANNITNPDRIVVGQTLKIPVGGSTAAATPAPATPRAEPQPQARPQQTTAPADEDDEAPATTPTPVAPQSTWSGPAVAPFEYEVREGDTIERLARDYSVLVEEILELNNMDPGTPLEPGQRLKMPGM
jgi:LysM repeat protein